MNNRREFIEALEGPLPVIVELGAAWCPPCRQLEPVLAQLAEKHAGAVAVFTIDVEEHPDLADRFGVRSLPTILAFSGGQVIAQQVGYSRRRLEELFDEVRA